MKLNINIITTCAFLINGIFCSAKMKRNYIMDEALESLAITQAPYLFWDIPMPSNGPPVSSVIGRRETDEKYDDEQRQLDPIGGAYLYDYRLPRDFDALTDEEKELLVETDATPDKADEKRSLDTLGNMQLHAYKKNFDSLGGVNLHGGYKRFISSLGGAQLHGYKRTVDDHDGNYMHPSKRYLSSLGGSNIHGGYKRGMSKRYLSSLGGGNIYKRPDTLGGVNLHADYKRFLSSLGGANIHDGGSKRTLSSLGGVNVHSGFKRELSSLGGAQIYGYKRDDSNTDIGVKKRELDSLGGYGIHRYRRSDATEESMDGQQKTR